MKTKYVVVVNDTWHEYVWIHHDLEVAKARAREYQAEGSDAQVYALVETHYYKAKEANADAEQPS